MSFNYTFRFNKIDGELYRGRGHTRRTRFFWFIDNRIEPRCEQYNFVQRCATVIETKEPVAVEGSSSLRVAVGSLHSKKSEPPLQETFVRRKIYELKYDEFHHRKCNLMFVRSASFWRLLALILTTTTTLWYIKIYLSCRVVNYTNIAIFALPSSSFVEPNRLSFQSSR